LFLYVQKNSLVSLIFINTKLKQNKKFGVVLSCRGEVAFCSNECREWYIKHTERNRFLGEIGTAPKP
jgi:hypothetical protein